MQAFIVTTARLANGRPHINPPMAFWDRQASYRHFVEAGGIVPRKHRLEPLMFWDQDKHFLVALHVVNIPDRPKYDRQFILELVKRILDGEISQSEASSLYGPGQSTISEWVRKYGDEVRRPDGF